MGDDPTVVLAAALQLAADAMSSNDRAETEVVDSRERVSKRVAAWHQEARTEPLSSVSVGEMPAAEAEDMLKRIAWLDRVGYHAWRAVTHLAAWSHP